MESFVLRGEGNLSWVGVAAYNLTRRMEQQHTRLLLRKDTQFFKVGLFVFGIRKNPNFMGYQFRSLSYEFAEEGKFPGKIKRGNINYWRRPRIVCGAHTVCECLDAWCAERGRNCRMRNEEWFCYINSCLFSLLSQIHTGSSYFIVVVEVLAVGSCEVSLRLCHRASKLFQSKK